MSNLKRLLRGLQERRVRYVTIGVSGINYYARAATELFATQDTDLFFPPDPANLLLAWETCDELGFELTSGRDPLDRPRDLFLARKVVDLRALSRASDGGDLVVDFTLVMAGFTFEDVWHERRLVSVTGTEVSVAPIAAIVRSKEAAGPPKDRLFLETYREILDDLRARRAGPPPSNPASPTE